MSLAKEQESLISLENINMALAQWQTRTVLCFLGNHYNMAH